MMIFAHQAKFVSRHRPWRAPERCLVEASIPRAYSQSPILSAWWNPFSKEASSDESTPSKADAERPPVPPPASTTPSASEPANPGSFLRGEGLAKEDIRDIGQELFLRNKHKVDDKVKGPQEMPADLLKFIQDVGPAKQSVDKQFTAPRLLEKENIEELEKKESSRQMIRQRKRMPLMGEDQNFTTLRNTNFIDRPEEVTKDDFGTTNLELHDFLSRKSMKECTDAVVGDFFNHIMPEQDCWTEDEKESHRQLLKQTLKALDLPVLLKDEEGNILGLYPERVPGPEIRSLQSIPTTKIRFVLEDVLDRDRSNESKAAENLERRRQERKATKN